MKIKLIIASILISLSAICQTKDKKKGIGLSLEVGAGYGTLTHTYDDKTPNNKDTSIKRNEIWVQPTARLSYHLFTFAFASLYTDFNPFIGYYNFGGKSKTNPNGYKDRLIFQSLEFGLIAKTSRRNRIIVSPSFKAQYIFKTQQKYFGTVNQADSIPRQWQTKTDNTLFKQFAISVGLNIRCKIKKMTLGIEGWYGLTNLNALSIDQNIGILNVKDINYRFLIGYDF